MKKIIVAALALVMAFALMACSMVSVNEEKDMAQVVVKVGEKTINKGEFEKFFENSFMQYGMTSQGYLTQQGIQAYNEYLNQALSQYADMEMLYQEALKKGLVDESEENKNAIKADIEASYEEIKEIMLSSVDPAITDETKRKEEADKQFNEYMESMGGVPQIDDAVNTQLKNDAIRAIQEEMTAGVTFSEEDAKAYYDEQSKTQAETIANSEDPSGTLAIYEQMGETAFVRPEEARYVKHILIGIPEEKKNEIATLRQASGDEEADKLSGEEADKLRDEELAKIKAQADEAVKRVNAGEDFDALIAELGSDEGMKNEPEKTQGYLVVKSSNFIPEFEEASLALEKVGDVTEPIATDFGYHIIKYVTDASGIIPFEELKDSIMSSQLTSKQNEAFAAALEKLKEGYKIELFPNALLA